MARCRNSDSRSGDGEERGPDAGGVGVASTGADVVPYEDANSGEEDDDAYNGTGDGAF